MALMDMSRVLRNPRFTRPVKLSRVSQTVTDKGRGVDATSEAMVISAIVQPATAEDLDRLPEGDAARGVIKVWTETPLVVKSKDRSPDVIYWDGSAWIVTTVDLWQEAPAFYVALCTRQEGAERG